MAQQDLRTGRVRPGQIRMAVHRQFGWRFGWNDGDDFDGPNDRVDRIIRRHREQVLQDQVRSIGWRHRHRRHTVYTEAQRVLAVRLRRRYQMPFRAIARRVGGGYSYRDPQPSPATIRRWVMASPNDDVEELDPIPQRRPERPIRHGNRRPQQF